MKPRLSFGAVARAARLLLRHRQQRPLQGLDIANGRGKDLLPGAAIDGFALKQKPRLMQEVVNVAVAQ